ncbi:MAG: hypothetical protein EHM70_10465 [Chloroflexota bacterium]|nr:MAG: hypothetical protein EHM70_10465 [Chloroflexota bacterium]
MRIRATFALVASGFLVFFTASARPPAAFLSYAYSGEKIIPTALPYTPQPQSILTQANLDDDGGFEFLRLEDERLTIVSSGEPAWESPPHWQVKKAAMTDLNRDGRLEATLLVRRPFKPWPVDAFMPHGGRIDAYQDSHGYSCHIILIGWKRGAYRELWAGSAMSDPLLDIIAIDLDGDGRQELAALESRYDALPGAPAGAITTWEWNGFGFTILARLPGSFNELAIDNVSGDILLAR